MKRLIEAVCAVFPETDADSLTGASTLGRLPGWDSMNAVNLLLEINARCIVDIEGFPLEETVMLAELNDAISERGGET